MDSSKVWQGAGGRGEGGRGGTATFPTRPAFLYGAVRVRGSD